MKMKKRGLVHEKPSHLSYLAMWDAGSVGRLDSTQWLYIVNGPDQRKSGIGMNARTCKCATSTLLMLYSTIKFSNQATNNFGYFTLAIYK